MTSIIGIKCKDGIVIGADSSATLSIGQFHLMEQPIEKIDIISGQVIVAGTGQIGLGQRFCAAVKKTWDTKDINTVKKTAVEHAKSFCKAGIDDFGQTHVKSGQYGALVAFPAEDQPWLCEFSVEDFQPELKTEKLWYGSMGSGQPITDPFLGFIRDIFWSEGLPSITDATFAVIWTLTHAIQINAGGINGPIRIAVLEEEGKRKGHFSARLLSESEMEEHKQNVEEVKKILRGLKFQHQNLEEAALIPQLKDEDVGIN